MDAFSICLSFCPLSPVGQPWASTISRRSLIPLVAERIDQNDGIMATGECMNQPGIKELLQSIPVGQERKLTKILKHYDEYFALLNDGSMLATSLAYQNGRVDDEGKIRKVGGKVSGAAGKGAGSQI